MPIGQLGSSCCRAPLLKRCPLEDGLTRIKDSRRTNISKRRSFHQFASLRLSEGVASHPAVASYAKDMVN